mgnify:CR=1 FL=1
MLTRLNIKVSYNLLKIILKLKHSYTFLYRFIFLNKALCWFEKDLPYKKDLNFKDYQSYKISKKLKYDFKVHYEKSEEKNIYELYFSK